MQTCRSIRHIYVNNIRTFQAETNKVDGAKKWDDKAKSSTLDVWTQTEGR